MKKSTKDILLLGGLGVAGYVAYRAIAPRPAAAAVPVPIAPSSGGGIGGLLSSIWSGISNMTANQQAAHEAAHSTTPPASGNFFTDTLNSLFPGSATPTSGLEEELGTLSGTVFGRRHRNRLSLRRR